MAYPPTTTFPRTRRLISELFKDDQGLQWIAADSRYWLDYRHAGKSVGLVQRFLLLSNFSQATAEFFNGDGRGGAEYASEITQEMHFQEYGLATLETVRQYKIQNNIINRNYQSQPDAKVGPMTIVHMDDLAKSFGLGAESADDRATQSSLAPVSMKPVIAAGPTVGMRLLRRT